MTPRFTSSNLVSSVYEKTETFEKGVKMAKDLDAYESQLLVGQVKSIRTDNVLNYIELLFSPTTKAQFYYDAENNNVQITFSDTDLRIADLVATVDKKTIKELITNLKIMYGQLEESQTTN